MENALAVIKRTAAHCRARGMTLLLENMLPHLFLGHPRDILWTIASIPEVTVGGATAVLLHWKKPLHAPARNASEQAIQAIIQLVVIALVILLASTVVFFRVALYFGLALTGGILIIVFWPGPG